MENELMFPIMVSGIRPGEETAVMDLIADAGLAIQDLDAKKLVHFIVARIGDTIVGAVGLEPVGDDALLRSLSVAADYRNRTVATRLVAAIEKYARAHGIGAVYLLTLDAADFFTKQNYRLVDRQAAPEGMQATEAFRNLCPATARCLYKAL